MMYTRLVSIVVMLMLPVSASAGPLAEGIARAAQVAAATPPPPPARSRGRVVTGIALLVAGAALTVIGTVDSGDDDMEMDDDGPIGDDSDAADKWLAGGGISVAAAGGILLLTGRRQSGPSVNAGRGWFGARHTFSF